MQRQAVWSVGGLIIVILASIVAGVWLLTTNADKTDVRDISNGTVKDEAAPIQSVDEGQEKQSADMDGVSANLVQSHEESCELLHEAIRQSKGQVLTEDVLRQLAASQQAGHDPAACLRKLYDIDGGVQERTIVLLALKKVGTPRAFTVLKEIALDPGKGEFTLGPRAVKALASLSDDPDKLSALLGSKSSRTRGEAAMALHGKELTDISVRRLGELLRSDSWVTHNLVAAAFATDRSTATVKSKVDLILTALPQLDHLENVPQADLPFGSTARDLALNSYVHALANMPGAGKLLREKLSEAREGGVEHQVLSLALALRKNEIAYPFVLQLAREDRNGFVRTLAVRGLGVVGSTKDLEFLEDLAAHDSYTQISRGHNPGKIIYPVRFQAKQAIAALREAK